MSPEVQNRGIDQLPHKKELCPPKFFLKKQSACSIYVPKKLLQNVFVIPNMNIFIKKEYIYEELQCLLLHFMDIYLSVDICWINEFLKIFMMTVDTCIG